MERLPRIFERIDDANSGDPERVDDEGGSWPAAELYGRRMSAWLERLYPDADFAQRVAARAQHIRRFERPRSDHPAGRAGYLAWRTELGRFHARVTAELLRQEAVDEATVARVTRMLEKRARKSSEDVQRIEDVACLVFFAHHALDFAAKVEPEKLSAIALKTWGKMSPHARRLALEAELPEAVSTLLAQISAELK